jgi:hypothetical protein
VVNWAKNCPIHHTTFTFRAGDYLSGIYVNLESGLDFVIPV